MYQTYTSSLPREPSGLETKKRREKILDKTKRTIKGCLLLFNQEKLVPQLGKFFSLVREEKRMRE